MINKLFNLAPKDEKIAEKDEFLVFILFCYFFIIISFMQKYFCDIRFVKDVNLNN